MVHVSRSIRLQQKFPLVRCFLLVSLLTFSFILTIIITRFLGISFKVSQGSQSDIQVSTVISTNTSSLKIGQLSTVTVGDNSKKRLAVTTGERADWGTDVYISHPFCEQLIDNPVQASTPLCKRDKNQICVDGSQKGMIPFFSQVSQDYYVYTRHFRNLKRGGVYLEAGTRHPITGSNTFFMDACLRWKGVCVEGNPETLSSIHRVRSCELVPTCVTNNDGSYLNFLVNGESGGIEHSNKNINEPTKRTVHTLKLQCMSMQVIFDRRNIKTLDYLSLDVEGHELEVLEGIDHTKSIINVMTIETTKESLPPIQKYLESVGYVRHVPDLNEQSINNKLLRRDAVFLHKDVIWGNPE